MRYEAILFDLDGTLLSMDNDEFIQGYFRMLGQLAAGCGYPAESFLDALGKGVYAMVKNDGSCPNAERFWSTIAAILGDGIYRCEPIFDRFYDNEFHETRVFAQYNPLAKQAVALAREKAEKVILATSPLFPTNAVHARMGWTGLAPEDFDGITDYENSGTCKPNPAYYLEIAEKFGLDPKKCLMVGNNVKEDIEAASAVGMSTFLVTDWLISEGEVPDCRKGSFEELIQFLQN